MRKKAALILPILFISLFSSCGTSEPPTVTGSVGTLSTVIEEQTYTLSEETKISSESSVPETEPPKTTAKTTAERPVTKGTLLPPAYVTWKITMPTVESNTPKRAQYLRQLSQDEYFIIYEVSAENGEFINELFYTADGGKTWERQLFTEGRVLNFQVLDREHFIIVSETGDLGISIYLFENGYDVSKIFTSVWSLPPADNIYTPDYFFHRSRFATGDYKANDRAYFKAVSTIDIRPRDDGSFELVCNYVLNNEQFFGTAIYDLSGLHPEV